MTKPEISSPGSTSRRWGATCYPVALGRLFILLISGASPTWAQQQATREMLLDVANIGDKDLAPIVRAVARQTNPTKWPSIRVAPDKNLLVIVNDLYRYFDSRYPYTANAIADVIREANGLDSGQVLPKGMILKVPVLPERPLELGARPGVGQVLDAEAGTVKLVNVGLPIKRMIKLGPGDALHEVPVDLAMLPIRQGAIWRIRADSAKAEDFIVGLSSDIRARVLGNTLYVGALDTVVEVFASNGTNISASGERPPLPRSDSTSPWSIGSGAEARYYLLDFFGATSSACSHGKAVLEVAQQVLTELGAPFAHRQLVPIELDIYTDRRAATLILDRYIATLSSGNRAQLKAAAEKMLRGSRPEAGKFYTSLLYLQSVYWTVLQDTNAVVASSSFWVRDDGYKVLPTSYTGDSRAVILSAVGDDPGAIEEAVKIEPWRSFLDLQKRVALILVGAFLPTGQAYGMTSSTGDGVTAVAQGSGWGGLGTCIRPETIGTSFATPALGAKLLFAASYLAERGVHLRGSEMRRRVLLASDISDVLVGHYASGGPLKLDLLLVLAQPVVVAAGGKAVAIAEITGSIKLQQGTSSGSDSYTLRGGDEGIGGLFISPAGESYVFRNIQQRWDKATVLEFDVRFVDAGEQFHAASLQDFSTRYKELLIP